jgi:hypothetical protein
VPMGCAPGSSVIGSRFMSLSSAAMLVLLGL